MFCEIYFISSFEIILNEIRFSFISSIKNKIIFSKPGLIIKIQKLKNLFISYNTIK